MELNYAPLSPRRTHDPQPRFHNPSTVPWSPPRTCPLLSQPLPHFPFPPPTPFPLLFTWPLPRKLHEGNQSIMTTR